MCAHLLVLRIAALAIIIISSTTTAKAQGIESILNQVLLKGLPPAQNQPHSNQEPTPSRDKAQYPCLSNLCLNDNVSTHEKTVKWRDYSKEAFDSIYEESRVGEVVSLGGNKKKNSSNAPPKVSRRTSELAPYENWIDKYVRNIPPETREKLLPYIKMHNFDAAFIKLLAEKQPVFCRKIEFVGVFLSESGYPTLVTVMPSSASSGLKVDKMERLYPGDRVEHQRVWQELQNQYPWLAGSLSLAGRQGNLNPRKNPWGGWAEFRDDGELYFKLGDDDEFKDASLAQQPACNEQRPSID